MARPAKFRLTPDEVLNPQHARKLAGHVAEIEFFRAEVEKLQAQIAGIYDAADDEGFDKKFIRKVVAIRSKDETAAQAEQAGIDAYTEALEIGFRSRARVENPEHDAETGEVKESTAARKGVLGNEGKDEASSARDALKSHSSPAGTQAPPVDTHSEPAAIPPTVAVEAARGGSVPSIAAAALKADRTKPHPWCVDPEECGPSSWDYLCEACKRRHHDDMAMGAVH